MDDLKMESNKDGMELSSEPLATKPSIIELCRLCANTDNQLIPIFRGEGLEHNISFKIEKHLPVVKVTESDKLPLQICYQCASTLIAWHNLYEGCKTADKRLRDILASEEKLSQDDDTFENFDDDYHDDYEDHSQTYPECTLSDPVDDTKNDMKNTSAADVKSVCDPPVFLETENNVTDARYASKTNGERREETTNFVIMVGDENRQECGGTRGVVECNMAEETPCENTPTNDFKCHFCPMVFLNKKDIGQHLRISHGEVYSRKNDSKKCSSPVKVNVSKKRPLKFRPAQIAPRKNDGTPKVPASTDIHKNETSSLYRCKICPKTYLTHRGFVRHKLVHKTVTIINCDYCQQSFVTNEEKQKHISEYHRINFQTGEIMSDVKEGKLINEIKMEIDVSQQNNGNHSSAECYNNEPMKVAKSEVVEKKATRRQGKKNESASINVETFTCTECGKSFDKRASFIRHQLTHSTAVAATCDICSKSFASESQFRKHKSGSHRGRRNKISEEDDPFRKWYVFADGQKHLKCDQCKYNSLWYHKGRFLEHYRIHTGEKPFTCDLCGKQFRTKTLLQKHVMYVHEGIKEHACDICGRRFSDKRYMEDHRRIHTGERPYVCDLCGKTFKQSASLFIHKELHKGLRKHACDMCGKRFTTRSSLTIHIKRHVGERNFVCATCGKAFVDGKHLRDHMAVHSEERPFACELCGGRFKLMKHLKQHGRTHKRDYII